MELLIVTLTLSILAAVAQLGDVMGGRYDTHLG